MISLLVKNGHIIIEGKDDKDIFDWYHRSFFITAAGYVIDQKNKKYLFTDKSLFHETLVETVEYLKEEGIQYIESEAVTQTLLVIKSEDERYKQAIKKGKIVKKSDQIKINIPGFKRVLKPYQNKGVEHLLAVENGANFSVPGSGKTTVILAVFAILKSTGVAEKLLVLGPRSSFSPWEEEAKACHKAPPLIARVTGSKVARESIYLQSNQYEIFLCTYQTAVNDIDEIIRLCNLNKVFVVIDESHNIKKIEGGVWSEVMLNIARYAVRRAILSGTPIPNSFLDLWTQITFLWPGKQVFGDRVSYQYRCEDEGRASSIKKSLYPIFFRVTKAHLGLPAPEYIQHKYDLSPYQASIYHALAVKFLNELDVSTEDRIILREWRKAKMVRLLQAASNPTLLAQYSNEFDIPPLSAEGLPITSLIDRYPLYEVPAKMQGAVNLVADLLSKGEKVVLWTSFVLNLEMLKKLLGHLEVYTVYGLVPRDASEDIDFNREQQINRFKVGTTPSVLIANPAACAESISLHKVCHHAIYLDRTFNCGQYLQSKDRIHRIGLDLDEKVHYHLLLAKNTIDETVDRRLVEKEKKMLQLLDDELPVGGFDVDENQMAASESEELIDFAETIKDLKKDLAT